ncbi:MAG: hypothetical protein ACM3PR_11415 [Bacteroidales bacterium]
MIELKNEYPQELKKTFNMIEYVEDGGIIIESVKYIDNNLLLEFTLSFGSYQIDNQLWQVNIIDIKKEIIRLEWASNLEIYSDHFLLYDYIDSFTELYFNGNAINPEKLFIDLYSKHINLYGNKLDFGTYLNNQEGIFKLCTYDNGLFARGPKKILEQYENCLKMHGIKTNYIGNQECEDMNLKLLIFGNSYFIGKEFSFKRRQ